MFSSTAAGFASSSTKQKTSKQFQSRSHGDFDNMNGFSFTSSATGLGYLVDRRELPYIVDSNVTVAFKGLTKKDSKTKLRAMDDLLSYIKTNSPQNGGVEEGVLEAWVQHYARLSIDDAQKVRELAHVVLYEFLRSTGKRMERFIPSIVGPWLAGTFDRDRNVSRSAQKGLSSFLTSEAKILFFWRRCQAQIVEFATGALEETPQTLSDMRISTREEANLKYYRVQYASLSLVAGLLHKLSTNDLDKQRDDYVSFFSSGALWKAGRSTVKNVRAAAYQLFSASLEKEPAFLEPHMGRLSRLLTQEALAVNQESFVPEYLTVLHKLTLRHPDIWSGEVHPFLQLRGLLEKQPQGPFGSANYQYWYHIDELLTSIPPRSITANDASDVLVAFRQGITSRTDVTRNPESGWTAYLSVVRKLIDLVSPKEEQATLIKKHVHPLLAYYTQPLGNTSSVWSNGALLSIITKASLLASRKAYPEVAKSTKEYLETLVEDLVKKVEVPGEEAQEVMVARAGERYFSQVADVHRSVEEHQKAAAAEAATKTTKVQANLIEESLKNATRHLLEASSKALAAGGYKQQGTAQLIMAAFQKTPYLFSHEEKQFAANFLPVHDKASLSQLLAAPSAEALLTSVRCMSSIETCSENYTDAFSAIVPLLLEKGKIQNTSKLISILVDDKSEVALRSIHDNAALQEYLCSGCHEPLRYPNRLFNMVMANQSLTPSAAKDLAAMLVKSVPNGDVKTMEALETLVQQYPDVLSDNKLRLATVNSLLRLSEMHHIEEDTESQSKVAAFRALVETKGNVSMVDILHQHLDQAIGFSPSSFTLQVDTLVKEAKKIETSTADIFPNTQVWMKSLQQLLQGSDSSRAATLSLTSDLGTAYFLVSAEAHNNSQEEHEVARDSLGNSIPIRMAQYTAELLQYGKQFGLAKLPQTQQVELLHLLFLISMAGADQLAVPDANGLWGKVWDKKYMAGASDGIDLINKLLSELVARSDLQETVDVLIDTLFDKIQQQQQEEPIGLLELYSARALSVVLQWRTNQKGVVISEAESLATKHHLFSASAKAQMPKTTLGTLAFVAGYNQHLAASKMVSYFCNRLISDVAGAKLDGASTKETLVLLDACMSVYASGDMPAAMNRVVFAIKQITLWFDYSDEEEYDENDKNNSTVAATMDPELAAVTCRVLLRLLPCIVDTYGPYWKRTLRFCSDLWTRATSDTSDARLVYVSASLKLAQRLATLQDPNDDLEEERTVFAPIQSRSVLRLLGQPPRDADKTKTGVSQPQTLVDSLLRRMSSQIPLEHIQDFSNVYGLLTSASYHVQMAGFSFLDRALPAAQSELAVTVLLDKEEAHLPAELLALLADAPTLNQYSDAELEQFPTKVRSYLLAWQVVFDVMEASPEKLRGDYAQQLGGSHNRYSDDFLNFLFDVLGHSAAHPINLAREGLDEAAIAKFDLVVAETDKTPEQAMHWLLVHQSYRFLRHLMGHFKTWYTHCKSQQTKVAVSAWVAKYLSPLLVRGLLDDLEAWETARQEALAKSYDEEEAKFSIKINRLASEVTANYVVVEDESTATIVVTVPADYPMQSCSVHGPSRVGVPDDRWKSWMAIVQGVIMFSHGSIADGLTTFRRNMQGILKGHEECAICYSIIDEVKRVPNKRCGTCHHMFHSSCLFKWFESSSNSKCPLCRNPISSAQTDRRLRRNRDE